MMAGSVVNGRSPYGLSFRALASSAMAVGAIWGTTCAWGDTKDSKFIQSATNLAGPWLVLAFLVGWCAKSPRSGAVSGLLVLATSVIAYYIAQAFGLRVANTRGVLVGVLWFPIASAAGAVLGGLGRIARGTNSRYRATAALVFGGALVAESGILLLNQGGFELGAVAYLALEMSVGLAVCLRWLQGIHQRRRHDLERR